MVAKIYMFYQHVDWAAEELRKIVSPIPETALIIRAQNKAGKPIDTEAMILLSGKVRVNIRATLMVIFLTYTTHNSNPNINLKIVCNEMLGFDDVAISLLERLGL
jgi:hypothetical protein